jgi:glycosyltransferase involved in cell wall biosynthesis
MKILIVTAGYPNAYNPLDGIFHKDQAEALAENHDVSVIAINAISIKHILKAKKYNFGFKKYIKNKVKTYHYTYINIPLYLPYSIYKSKTAGQKIFKKYMQENGLPDIIHLQCFEAVLLAGYIKDKYNIPFVVTEHSSRFNNDTLPASISKYAEIAFAESACNVTVSEELANKMSKKYQKHFIYIPNIIDTDYFIPSPYKAAEFTLINVAGLIDIKNHRLLIDAFKLAQEKINELKLIIIGDGYLKNELNTYIQKLNLNNSISLLGYLNRAEILKHLQTSHCFVLSSKTETFGVALVEAMSCGLPVISTISSGPKSIIKHNYLGMLCEHDAEQLSEKIFELYINYKHFDSNKIRQFAIENFSKLAVSKLIENTYKQVLEQHYGRTSKNEKS